MSKIYITGHRNPDMDSLCSAYAYAVLKNKIDPENEYIPVRASHRSAQIKRQFALLNAETPMFLNDVTPTIKDVMLGIEYDLYADEPFFNLVRIYDTNSPTSVPVKENGEVIGLFTIDAFMKKMVRDNATECPVYELTVKNMQSVTKGNIIHMGKEERFSASLVAGSAKLEYFEKAIEERNRPVVVLSFKKEFVDSAVKMQVPAIVLSAYEETPDYDFSSYEGTVITTTIDTAETLRRIRLSPEIKGLMGEQGASLAINDSFETGKETLAESKFRGLSVVDGDKWVGFVSRRCFLKKPAYKVILVDHNEAGQSVRGIETAQILEIIDHHRLNSLKTKLPIYIDSEPVGSTCTIVYNQFVRHGVEPDEHTATVLLAGVLCDTIILKSPTTTDIDRVAAKALSRLSGKDIDKFGKELFSNTEPLSMAKPEDAITSDFKVYMDGKVKLGIGQYETTSFKDIFEYAPKYIEKLMEVAKASGLDWAMLMVTDVEKGSSKLIVTPHRLNSKLPYVKEAEGVYDMPRVMSRKKQLLPEVLHTFS
ncbi:MAG: putative manganese-dependent inorganic diphosphatase [Eubacteriales bacterium]|nr:putative manganese-dependent inorganic diphosphatase [Eubacteriales bacterium]